MAPLFVVNIMMWIMMNIVMHRNMMRVVNGLRHISRLRRILRRGLRRRRVLRRGPGRYRLLSAPEFGDVAFDDFLDFAPVEPHAATRRAVVDFDAQSLGHLKRSSVNGAVHARFGCVNVWLHG